jgi:hypothetical protein
MQRIREDLTVTTRDKKLKAYLEAVNKRPSQEQIQQFS